MAIQILSGKAAEAELGAQAGTSSLASALSQAQQNRATAADMQTTLAIGIGSKRAALQQTITNLVGIAAQNTAAITYDNGTKLYTNIGLTAIF